LIWAGSAVPKLTDPLFQNYLVIWFDPRKNDTHVTVRRGIGYLAKRRERAAFAGDSYSQFGSSREGFAGVHTTAIQTQVGDSPLKLKFCLHVDQFDTHYKRIAASPWTFDVNWILEFVTHIFIFRKACA